MVKAKNKAKEVKTEVKEKSSEELAKEIQEATGTEAKDDLPGKEGAKNTAEALEKQEENKDGLRVDPSIDQLETDKAKEIAKIQAEAKAEEDKIRAEAAAKPAADPVETPKTDFKEEPTSLAEAVKADAEKRGKTFEKCLVTGVLVVK